ncbi:hypothetical protein BDV28DRAFT_80664 [Aspergillus coremiiformis]|uniref:Integral membrane protein n=1 Tax=Aspergillus coremiiformis TaxID=138285 RepID=A0A5N6ZA08_9EURO|nr:hypothetical protein BDV28DRAFT_80664 [Aspergillus coremiiformis]
MTSPAEQMFLFGEIIDSEPVSGLALLGYADLTGGSAIIFATITTSAYIASDWKDLSPWILALLRAVVRPIRAVVLGICWLVMQLAAARSLTDVFHTLRTLKDGVKSRIFESRLRRLASAVVNWYFPFNRPLATVCRLSLSFIGGMIAVYGLLLPAVWHVSGLIMAVSSPDEELSDRCFDDYGRLEQRWLNRHEWLEAMFCLGQETGLELRAIIRDDWQLPRLIEGEIHHLYALALVTTSVLCATLAALSWYALEKIVRSRRVDKLQPAAAPRADPAGHETQLQGTPPTPHEVDLWNMIDRYEGVIAKQNGLLIAKTEELRVVKQRMEDGWALAKTLSARPAPVEKTQPREPTVLVGLRQELAQKEWQVSVAQGKLRQVEDDATAMERSLRDRVTQLEQQLAREREQVEEAKSLQHCLAAFQVREQSRDRIETERQQLVVRNTELVAQNQELTAQNQELTAQYQAFQAEHDRLQQQFREFTVTIQQERDAALGRVIFLQAELAATQSSTENVVRETQESLARAQQSDAVLRQTMSDLKHACDMSLEQARAAVAEAQKQASDLTEEVNDLQTKIGMAMRDAQRSHEQAQTTERTNQILEHRLAHWGASRNSQEIPKRPSRNVGSISTALGQCQVTVSQQQTEINDLRQQLGKAKQGLVWPSEQVAQENIQKLQEALSNEKRARAEDSLRWGKMTRELEGECQKLRISLSNAAASTPVRRPGSRRPPTLP